MKVYEYGLNNRKKVLFIATAALEPYWAFEKQARKLGDEYHVYAVSADGHDGQPGDFISIEKTVSDMTAELKKRVLKTKHNAHKRPGIARSRVFLRLRGRKLTLLCRARTVGD